MGDFKSVPEPDEVCAGSAFGAEGSAFAGAAGAGAGFAGAGAAGAAGGGGTLIPWG